MRRVVVTGMGLLSPFGHGVSVGWEGVLSGRSAIRRLTGFDDADFPVKIGAQLPKGDGSNGTFNPDNFVPLKEQKKMDPFIIYGLSAAIDAVQDSGWMPEDEEGKFRTGVLIGSGIGGIQTIQNASVLYDKMGARRISPFFIPSCLINMISGHVSIRFGFKGPNHAVVTACATGTHAIGDAARLIMLGDADVMVAGGAEAAICSAGMVGFSQARALSTSYNDTPEKASRPWDKGRDGFVMGEGAGVVVLEEYEHAKKRGAKIYAEWKGYGLSGDGYHITAPSPDGIGAFRAMESALKSSGLAKEDIGYINAHGTSTPLGDQIELQAVQRIFGSHAEKLSMSSTKSSIGHLLGAAGAVETIFSIMALNTGLLPPTLNLENPDEGAEKMDLIPHKAKEKKVSAVMSNSFGFGGTNATLIFSKV